MKHFKKHIALLMVATTLGSTFGALNAREMSPVANNSGYAYEGSHRASTVSPAIVLGSVAAAAVIAVLVTNDSSNRYKGSYHSHSH